MKRGAELKQLRKKLRSEREYKNTLLSLTLDSEKIKKKKKILNKSEKLIMTVNKVLILKKLLIMIEDGATGFDLAMFIDKYDYKNEILHDGILFYNYFKEIGTKVLKDVSDRKESKHRSFNVLEDSEKAVFIKWANDFIKSTEEEIDVEGEYKKYIEKKKLESISECKNCGAKFTSNSQRVYEHCGEARS